jgi:exopolysaccharide biosynthesis polyprenyl glycosylphosphotransferase
VVVLVVADLLTFVVLRAAIRAVRDVAVFGDTLARYVAALMPRGYLGGWQFGAALLVGLTFAGTYGRGDNRRDLGRLFIGVSLGVGLALWQSLWVVHPFMVLLQLVVTVTAMWVGLAFERRIADFGVARYFRHRAERVLFVGDREWGEAKQAHERLVKGERVQSLGWVWANGRPADSSQGYLGSIDGIWGILDETGPDTVVLCGDLPDAAFESLIEAANVAGCQVLGLSRQGLLARLKPGLVWHQGIPFVQLSVPALQARELFLKRVIDVLGSGVGLILLSPVFAVIAAAIKLDSPGRVFFSQERVGYAGRVFRMLKFRTMRVGADGEKADLAHLNYTGDPRLFKIPDDPRITRVGAWLRRWSLDELPQLINVFLGHMSLVGPRPFFESDLKEYLDHHFMRLGAKPGITGLWQVNGRSAVVDFEEVVRLDREYIDRWSLLLDLRILAQTLPAVMRKTGAY